MSKSNHAGSRKVKKIVENAWSKEIMLEAIDKIQTLRFHLNKLKNGEGLQKVGWKCAFPTDQEKSLAKCIRVLCRNGFSPSLKEI